MEDAAARKARLKALREQAGAAADTPSAPATTSAPPEEPVLKFRNYAVQDKKNVAHEQIAAAQPPQLEEPVVEKKPELIAQEELLISAAPKKANWDLKRDIQGKLDKLERRTQRAIIEIMRQQEQEQMAG